MKKMNENEKSKMRAISLDNETDSLLLEVGDGSRTAGVRELVELYQIVSGLQGESYKEKKYKMIGMIQDKRKVA
jgi:hypothetical protein